MTAAFALYVIIALCAILLAWNSYRATKARIEAERVQDAIAAARVDPGVKASREVC